MVMSVNSAAMSCRFRAFVAQAADLTSGSLDQDFNFSDELTNGTGADNANQTYFDDNTLIASASQSYDLTGTLADVFGNTITFARVKGLFVWNKSTAGVLRVGGGTGGDGTNAWDTWVTGATPDGGESVIVRPGGMLALFAPDATAYVTAEYADLLVITETAAQACQYYLAVVGARAA